MSDEPELHDGPTEDPRISALHAAGREAPPAALDELLLARARQAAARTRGAARTKRFVQAFATAAVAVLGLAVTLQVLVRPTPLAERAAGPIVEVQRAAPASAASAAPTEAPVASDAVGSERSQAASQGSQGVAAQGAVVGAVEDIAEDPSSGIVVRTREAFDAAVDKPSLPTASELQAPLQPAAAPPLATSAAARAPRTDSPPATAADAEARDSAASAKRIAPADATLQAIARDIAERGALLDRLEAEGRQDEYQAQRARFCADYPDQERCR
jgi:hypothetical protein